MSLSARYYEVRKIEFELPYNAELGSKGRDGTVTVNLYDARSIYYALRDALRQAGVELE